MQQLNKYNNVIYIISIHKIVKSNNKKIKCEY